MPQRGIHAYYWMSDHWTIEYNEIASNKVGLEFAPNFTIRNNYIHHNVGNSSSLHPAERGGGYVGQYADNTTFDSNEIAYNGPEQKVGQSANVTFRNNFVHHNLGDGIWYDTNADAGALVEGNRVEDNGRNGIFFEGGIGATIRNNTLGRNAGDAVFISMSQSSKPMSGASSISSTATRFSRGTISRLGNLKSWNEWPALAHDVGGSMSEYLLKREL